jgi:hypothetical protein
VNEIALPVASPCESVRGEWGQVCPDCGQRLPTAKPWSEGRPCSRTTLLGLETTKRRMQLREAQRRHRARPR